MTSKHPDFVARHDYSAGSMWQIHQRQLPKPEANLAMLLAERWALVAAIPDGEDSAGRQKLRLPTADELAGRSADIAAKLWEEFEKRGWLLDVPTVGEAEKAIDERRKREKANDRE